MSTRRVASLIAVLAALAALVLAVGACGSTAGESKIVVAGAWVRPVPAGGDTAAYFTVANPGSSDDTLVGVSATTAAQAGLHKTSTDGSGMTGMAHTDSITVPAGGSVELKAGGYHVMLTSVTKDFVIGDSIELILTFERAGVVRTTAEVKGG
jgi:copper(I)-binding protein